MDRYQDEIRRAAAKGVRDLNLDKANGVAREGGFLLNLFMFLHQNWLIFEHFNDIISLTLSLFVKLYTKFVV